MLSPGKTTRPRANLENLPPPAPRASHQACAMTRSAHAPHLPTYPPNLMHRIPQTAFCVALAGALAGSACAIAIVWTTGINRALALDACRQEAKAAHLSTDHCYQR